MVTEIIIGILCLIVGIFIGFLYKDLISKKEKLNLDQLHKNELTNLNENINQLNIKIAQVNTMAIERDKENTMLRNQATEDQKVINSLKPFEEKLETVKKAVIEIERSRATQYAQLNTKLTDISASERRLDSATKSLEGALKSTTIRGSWGEIELERVLELSGLKKNIDYVLQKTLDSKLTENGALRPDATIDLPGNKHIAIDAKTSMGNYFEAVGLMDKIDIDAQSNEAYKIAVQKHIISIKKHIQALEKKEYWSGLEQSPDFTIMFIPNEATLDLALKTDPTLTDYAASKGVIITTPTSLLGVLKSVATILQYFSFAKKATELQTLGKNLFDSFKILSDNLTKLGNSISSTAKNYNKVIGTYESSFLKATNNVKNITPTDYGQIEQTNFDTTRQITKTELLQDK
jgi:DNA recombination protein RmuC